MKKKHSILVLLGVFTLALLPNTTLAQDWKNVNPKMNRILADTTFVRGTEVTLQPGEKSDMHTHPAHFFYALSEGKMMVYYKDGKSQPYDLKPGFAGVSGPERPHMTENVGNTTVKFLIVELKEHPYKESKKEKKK